MTEFDRTMAQWQAFKERAERIRAMMHQRAIAAYCRAFGNEPTPTSTTRLLRHRQFHPVDAGRQALA